jgi:hypothetical protein
MDIKPIETLYKGYRFRSRLEARWAVFFDALGIKWEYEKEGYELDGARYLPDFWLPQMDSWFEGKSATREERKKAMKLSIGSKKAVYLFAGEIEPNMFGSRFYDYCEDDACQWVMCLSCKEIKILWTLDKPSEWQCKSGHMLSDEVNVINKAFLAGRQARFEHGEGQPTPHLYGSRPQLPPPVPQPFLPKKVKKVLVSSPQYHPNDMVNHALFGRGTVLDSEIENQVEYVTVLFDDQKMGVKRFRMDFAKLEKLS